MTDREIVESLVELKGGLNKLNTRFDDTNRRFDGRFDDVNRRFDDMNGRFDDLKGLLYVILAGIFVLFGFVLWYRSTALTPAMVLRELARQDQKVKDAMKHAGFM